MASAKCCGFRNSEMRSKALLLARTAPSRACSASRFCGSRVGSGFPLRLLYLLKRFSGVGYSVNLQKGNRFFESPFLRSVNYGDKKISSAEKGEDILKTLMPNLFGSFIFSNAFLIFLASSVSLLLEVDSK